MVSLLVTFCGREFVFLVLSDPPALGKNLSLALLMRPSGGEDGHIGPHRPNDHLEWEGGAAFSRRCHASQVGEIRSKVKIMRVTMWCFQGGVCGGLRQVLHQPY